MAPAAASDQRGAALVEFALVLPVLLLVVVGISQFGLAVNSANDETHIANEAARYATVNQNPCSAANPPQGCTQGASLQTWGKKQGDQNALNNGGTICISFPSGTSNIGDPVKVSFTSTVSWLPILRKALNGITQTSVTGTAYMRLEASPTQYAAGCA